MTVVEIESFPVWLSRCSAAVEQRLTELLSVDMPSPPLAAAMRDAVLTGGKRLRPAVLFAVAEKEGSLPPGAVDAACALECIHCYSLIHDDLPCMDDDDIRRGRPACHKQHGEATALLAGDCLQSLAFETMARSGLPASACALLALAAGAQGMGGGQALDITAAADNDETLSLMHRLKTGALFTCALELGLLLRADSAGDDADAVNTFAAEFGLLYQIVNDLQDYRQDKDAGKQTFATVSPDTAHRHAAASKHRAVAAVQSRYPRLADITHAVYPQ